MRLTVPLVGPWREDASKDAGPERTVNWLPRPGPSGYVLDASPGLTLAATIGGGPIRGARVWRGGASAGSKAFVVSGNTLYEVDASSYTATGRGTLATASGAVQMTDNGTQFLLVESSYQNSLATAYLYDTATEQFVNLRDGLEALTFTSGGTTEIVPGNTITGATSGETAVVVGVTLDPVTPGSWAGGDAAGTLWINAKSGALQAENLNVGAATNLATIAGDSEDATLDFAPGGACGFLDGFFYMTANGTGRFYWCALYNGLDWPALYYSTAEGDPDNLVSLAINGRNLWLLGESTTEVAYSTGDPTEAAKRISGAVASYGAVAPNGQVQMGDRFLWLGKSHDSTPVVLEAAGYGARVVSSPPIERVLAAMSTLTDARAFAFRFQGQDVAVWTFPTADQTWAYLADGSWVQLAHWDSTEAEQQRILGDVCVRFSDAYLLGSREDGKLYEIDATAYSDAGDLVVRERITQHVEANGQHLRMERLVLVLESGVGATGEDAPRVVMRYSDDGGHTWSKARYGDMGKVGEYGVPIVWRRLGQFRRRCFKFTYGGTQKATLLALYADVEAVGA